MKRVLFLFLCLFTFTVLFAFYVTLFAVCVAFPAIILTFLLPGGAILLYSPLHAILNADYSGGILLLGIALILLGLSLFLIKAVKPFFKLIAKAADLSLVSLRKFLFEKGV